ncbi:MAG: chemotaxis protein CheA [Candidatus Manganitrophus sp.]|nr:chemotaxis protein CheA [Candidatus Manganitrophus sp.]WDT72515.1 MAG: chemotaxis protein CheA [Candidatus Manganitrophus sp.]WDT80028.1 MAG: chemotaxis protein CheA [Candidatus Manganitrophus sp.]
MAEKGKDPALDDFVPEAEELIEVLHQNLRQIETLPDRTQVRPDVINAIFRAAHTLKGMSGMIGLSRVSQVSHHLEDMLDKLRMGKLTFSAEIFNVLVDGVDLLQKMIESAAQGKEEPEISQMEERIQAALSGKPQEGGANQLDGVDLDPSILNVLTEYESHRLFENIKSNATLFEVKARFKLETFDTDLSSLNEKIQRMGEIITTLPSISPSPEGGMEFNLIVGIPPESAPLGSEITSDQISIREIQRKGKKGESSASPKPGAIAPVPLNSEGASSPAPPSSLSPQEGASLRSMAQTVRVDIQKLDVLLNMVGELVLSKAVVSQISKELLEQSGFSGLSLELLKASRMLDKRISEFQEKLVEVRMIPIGQIFDRLVRTVRRLSRDLNKEVNLMVSGEETKMDKSMVEDLADPLLHLIRNALDHGIESREERIKAQKPEVGTIHLRAIQKGNHIVIEVEDDGGGIDADRIYKKAKQRGLIDPGKKYSEGELIHFLFLPGFSTAEQVTEISGRGVGLDVVAKNIAKLSGLVDVETTLGRGTLFTITLPITLIIIKALIVRVGMETFAIPLNSVSESLMVSSKEIKTIERKEVVQLRDHTLSLVRLNDLFELDEGKAADDRLYVIVVGLAEKRIGLVVDAVEGQQEIVIKSLGGLLKDVPGISGATELGNRKTILVLDVASLIDEATLGKEKKIEIAG